MPVIAGRAGCAVATASIRQTARANVRACEKGFITVTSHVPYLRFEKHTYYSVSAKKSPWRFLATSSVGCPFDLRPEKALRSNSPYLYDCGRTELIHAAAFWHALHIEWRDLHIEIPSEHLNCIHVQS